MSTHGGKRAGAGSKLKQDAAACPYVKECWFFDEIVTGHADIRTKPLYRCSDSTRRCYHRVLKNEQEGSQSLAVAIQAYRDGELKETRAFRPAALIHTAAPHTALADTSTTDASAAQQQLAPAPSPAEVISKPVVQQYQPLSAGCAECATARAEHAAEVASLRSSQADEVASLKTSLAAATVSAAERMVVVKREKFDAQVDAHAAAHRATSAKRKADASAEELEASAKRQRTIAQQLDSVRAEKTQLEERLKELTQQQSELVQSQKCIGCLETLMDQPRAVLPCGHVYGCVECGKTFLEHQQSLGAEAATGCPVCRAELPQLHEQEGKGKNRQFTMKSLPSMLYT